VRKQFPLTSIVDIVYNEDENPLAFKLVFHKSEMLLEDVDKRQCQLWVIAITKGKHFNGSTFTLSTHAQ